MYGASRSSSKQQVIDPISRYIHTRRPDALQLDHAALHLSVTFCCFCFFCSPFRFVCCGGGGFYDTPHQQFLHLLVRCNSQLYYYTIYYMIPIYLDLDFCVCCLVVATLCGMDWHQYLTARLSLCCCCCVQKYIYIYFCIYIYISKTLQSLER